MCISAGQQNPLTLSPLADILIKDLPSVLILIIAHQMLNEPLYKYN